MNSKAKLTGINAGRRTFLRYSARLAGGALVSAATLRTLNAHAAQASYQQRRLPFETYGHLMPVPDQHGDEILALPRGFRYVTFSKLGAPISDGSPTPRNHDGMCAFANEDGTVRLIRNHEVRNAPGDREGAVEGSAETRYDPLGVGGTVTIDFDVRSFNDAKRFPPVVREFVSLNGTIVNCSGGCAFRDTGWLSCEETTEGPTDGWRRKHGYAFFTPVSADTTVTALPIIAMGRFKHEAAVADPVTGIVYETEDDDSNSGFYRFVPNDPRNLFAGGTLQMLRIAGSPQADLRDGQTVGQYLRVDWVTVDDPDPELENGSATVFRQGFRRGGARFARLEGIFRGEQGSIYFTPTRAATPRTATWTTMATCKVTVRSGDICQERMSAASWSWSFIRLAAAHYIRPIISALRPTAES